MNNEYRVYGPPGTGKTTEMARRIVADAEVYGRDNIMVASFSKAAAAELASRNTGLDKKQIGTLHSHCYNLLGKQGIAEDHKAEWNNCCPAYEFSEGSTSLDETIEQSYKTEGDRILGQLNVLRGKMVPLSDYPADVLDFYKRWIAFKRENEYIDFCDMIENVYFDKICPPYDIAYIDEGQDLTPLEMAVVRMWGEQMKFYTIAADDDQTIFGFKGCTPQALLHYEIPMENKTILTQSYRVPRVIQKLASSYIKQVQVREPKEYKPKDAEGEIIRLDTGFKDEMSIVDDAEKYIQAGKTVMFLTACSYMLTGITSELRRRVMPFYNPYRKSNGAWNPLSCGNGISATQRLLAFLKDEWTNNDIYMWGTVLRSKDAVLHGAKKNLEKFNGDMDEKFNMNRLDLYFTSEALESIKARDVIWYYNNLLVAKQLSMQYSVRILRKYGKQKLTESPQIIIGTIHSVKGGEADVVYLFPDISVRAAREQELSYDKRDDTIRQFYVGMTRAKETLILCEPSSQCFMQL